MESKVQRPFPRLGLALFLLLAAGALAMRPASAQTSEAQAAEAKASEAKAAEAKAGEAKAGEAKASEAKAAPPRPGSNTGRVVLEQTAGRLALSLEAGSGRVLSLPGPAANVFVADPRVAEVRPASISSLFVFGVGPGRTTVAVMDTDGRAISQIEVTVRPNTFVAGEAEATVAKLLANSRIRVTAQARGLLLTGTVASPADAARAVSVARGYVLATDTVENQLSVQSSVQINLRVRIIEMNRSVTRSLGVDWSAMGSLGKFAIMAATTTGVGAGLTAVGSLRAGTPDVNSLIQALAQDNLVRVLAEPNLTVMSGQAGSFLAGGEFPVPVGQQNGTITIEFKKYGVTLGVVPTVLSDGRINLHVNPEVSQLTTTGAVTLTAANATLSVPALTVRRAETSVELGSGQTFAIAGLLQDQSTQTTNGIPWLGEVPILGALFRSSSFQRQETELVILVTPYIVNPVEDQAKLHAPDERFTAPTDLERILLLRQTGSATAQASSSVPMRIPGAAGFIVQ